MMGVVYWYGCTCCCGYWLGIFLTGRFVVLIICKIIIIGIDIYASITIIIVKTRNGSMRIIGIKMRYIAVIIINTKLLHLATFLKLIHRVAEHFLKEIQQIHLLLGYPIIYNPTVIDTIAPIFQISLEFLDSIIRILKSIGLIR
jgi:hypothetical protein